MTITLAFELRVMVIFYHISVHNANLRDFIGCADSLVRIRVIERLEPTLPFSYMHGTLTQYAHTHISLSFVS